MQSTRLLECREKGVTMSIAGPDEADRYLESHSDLCSLEVLTPDMNGILRAKRIPREEIRTLYSSGITGPASAPILNTLGDSCSAIGLGTIDGDPDKWIRPVAETLAPIPWLRSATHQVLGYWTEADGTLLERDCRAALRRALQPLTEMGYRVTVAMELEFYLLDEAEGPIPRARLGRIPGTTLPQTGTQYCSPEDMGEFDDFLEAVRLACEAQDIPATTAHPEFAPGQLEINLHHVDDPEVACDHAVLLKRLIKGVARSQSMGATFMAKPFPGVPGSGLHIHVSLYDQDGNNVFADPGSGQVPPVSAQLRHAVGGLGELMPDCQAIFAPNANSYRRLQPGVFAPLAPNWGYNHRNVSLRIPVSGTSDTRIEHRVAGADANPYLVLAAVLAGVHYGLENRCEPGPFISESEVLGEEEITLARNWPQALDRFAASRALPRYLGEEYCRIFEATRRDECEQFNAVISNVDYEWYLRAV